MFASRFASRSALGIAVALSFLAGSAASVAVVEPTVSSGVAAAVTHVAAQPVEPGTVLAAKAPAVAAAKAPAARKAKVAATKTLRYHSNYRTIQTPINQCRGAVAYRNFDPSDGAPWVVFEHNYCGGKWLLSARKGTLVKIRNGALAGTWRANGIIKTVPKGTNFSVTKNMGKLVMQTCTYGKPSKLRLVGFTKIG